MQTCLFKIAEPRSLKNKLKKKYLKTNENENTMAQKLWDIAQAALRRKIIAI